MTKKQKCFGGKSQTGKKETGTFGEGCIQAETSDITLCIWEQLCIGHAGGYRGQ